MNGPCGMYPIAPHYEYPKTIEKPKCMYDIQSIYSTNSHPATITNYTSVSHANDENKSLMKLEERQKRLINQLEELAAKLQQIKQQMTTVPAVISVADAVGLSSISAKREASITHLPDGLPLDVVIVASANSKLIALQILTHWLRRLYRVDVAYHTHSSIDKPIHTLPLESLKNHKVNQFRNQQQIIITLIWKDVGVDPQLMVSPSQQHTAVRGEVNILRYLTTLLLPSRYFPDSVKQTEVDVWLDAAYISILHGSNQERYAMLRTLGSHMEKRHFLVGNELSVADVGMLSAILQTQLVDKLSSSLKKWFTTCSSDAGVSAGLATLPSVAV